MNKERCPKCLVDDQYCDVSCRFMFECGTTNVQGNSTQHTDNCFIGYFSANCRTCSFQFRKISSQRRALSVQWAKATHTLESGGCRTVSLPSCIGLGNARQGFNWHCYGETVWKNFVEKAGLVTDWCGAEGFLEMMVPCTHTVNPGPPEHIAQVVLRGSLQSKHEADLASCASYVTDVWVKTCDIQTLWQP